MRGFWRRNGLETPIKVMVVGMTFLVVKVARAQALTALELKA